MVFKRTKYLEMLVAGQFAKEQTRREIEFIINELKP